MQSQLLQSLNPSPKESKKVIELLAQESGIKDHESMSRNEALSALKASENKNNTRIEKIREEIKKLWHKFSNDCNWIRTHNHLVHKRTLNHLAKLVSQAKWLSVRL